MDLIVTGSFIYLLHAIFLLLVLFLSTKTCPHKVVKVRLSFHSIETTNKIYNFAHVFYIKNINTSPKTVQYAL